MAATTSTGQPNTTLYIKNLNDKVQKDELRHQLYALFTTYGRIIDMVVSKAPRMRGQAWLVFADLASATTALRACQGMVFYDKPMVCIALPLSVSSIERVCSTSTMRSPSPSRH